MKHDRTQLCFYPFKNPRLRKSLILTVIMIALVGLFLITFSVTKTLLWSAELFVGLFALVQLDSWGRSYREPFGVSIFEDGIAVSRPDGSYRAGRFIRYDQIKKAEAIPVTDEAMFDLGNYYLLVRPAEGVTFFNFAVWDAYIPGRTSRLKYQTMGFKEPEAAVRIAQEINDKCG